MGRKTQLASAVIMTLWLTACEPQADPAPIADDLAVEVPVISPAEAAPAEATKEEIIPPMDDVTEIIEPGAMEECLGDYCPCDKSDPDYGGADEVACRYIEAGQPVDEGTMAGAAALRDARRQIREFETEHGAF